MSGLQKHVQLSLRIFEGYWVSKSLAGDLVSYVNAYMG